MSLFDEISSYRQVEWPPFSNAKISNTITKYSSLFTSDLDHISWNYLKKIVSNFKCIINIVNIANAYINLSYWTSHFKKSMSIIIPKPNKSLYNNSKIFCPIVLLNTLGKLIKKMISNRLKVHSVASNFLCLNQLGGIRQYSTIDTGIFLTHLIWIEWIKEINISTLMFNIAQFFPSLNHQLLPMILSKADLNIRILQFFSSYLIGRQTQYV